MSDSEDNYGNISLEEVSKLPNTLRHRASSAQFELIQTSCCSKVVQAQETQTSDELEAGLTEHYQTSEHFKIFNMKAGIEDEQSEMVTEDTVRERDTTLNKGWTNWTVCDYHNLPLWLQDNEYLITGHRPPLPSFFACFCSIFRFHTETINIWTHLLGCVAFIILAILFLSRSSTLQEKLSFTPFFAGAILCLGFSFTFHTVHCHSPDTIKLFSRLDYCGITLLIMGSFIPYLYYGFYCHFWLKVIYLTAVLVLGICTIVVSLWETFSEPKYRSFRACVFTVFGLSAVVPGLHYIFIEGLEKFVIFGTPLVFTACLYIFGAALYACRVPEKIFLGKCDIWFQSHQIFHVLVVVATFINYRALLTFVAHLKSTDNYCS